MVIMSHSDAQSSHARFFFRGLSVTTRLSSKRRLDHMKVVFDEHLPDEI
jgi:hypothetical protein